MAKSKKLAYSVTLWNAEAGQYDTFYPGMELPGWAAGQVKNPAAFAEEEVQPTAGTEELPVPGPSQLPYHTSPDLVQKNRMATGTGMERGSGVSITQDTVRVDTVNPQPTLHDEVAKAANRATWTTDAGELAFKLRQGVVPSDQDLRNAENLVEDAEMNTKAEEQQAEIAKQLAAAAYDEAMLIQSQAAVQAATALSAVPGAAEKIAAMNTPGPKADDADEKPAAKKAASKKAESSSEDDK